jgi:Lipopolysaccharide-assembly
MIQRPALLFWLTLLLCSGCYSFKGISIDPDVNTFFVQNFETSASNAPPTLALDFTERLKDKIRSESRLVLKSDNPDVEFTGRISSFVVVPVAPKPGEVVSLNQLKISVAIKYINNKNEKKSWPSERTKSHFAEFSNTADLLTVQDELIRQISTQLLDDIFNEAFNDW